MAARARRFVYLLGAASCVMAAFGSAPAAAADGKVVVTISAPAGVPVNVLLRGGGNGVAAKPAAGRQVKVTLSLGARRYRVSTRAVAFRGRFYLGSSDRDLVRVVAGRTARVRVRYRRVPSSSRLRATKIDGSGLSLTWSAPQGASFALRRAPGRDAPGRRTSGTAVATKGAAATDTGLVPGKRYSYALFTKVGRRWTGPLTLSAATAPPPGSTAAAYISAPGTLLAEPSDVASATPTGTGVALRLTGDAGPPLIGTVVVLSPSASLPGGFLGRVVSIGTDGTAVLAPAGLDDAFDFYSLDVPEFLDSSLPLEPTASGRSTTRAASQVLKACAGGSQSSAITLKPSLALGGHFKVEIDKFKVFGKEIPKGASLDMKFTVTATAAIDANASLTLKCQAPAKPLLRLLTTSPVPISFYFSPVAEATVTGSAQVSNVGATATAGFRFNGSFGVTSGVKIDGSPIFSAGPTQSSGAIEGSIGAALGGEVIIGPGAGTASAGVIAGVGGKLNVVDASIGPVFPVGDKRRNACLKTQAAFTRELNLTAKAWVGNWDVSRSVTFDFLRGRTEYGGSPWFWPTDCTQLPADAGPPPEPPDPGDSVVGDGVTVVDDSTTGSPDQTGYVDGFVPGGKSWVLSTGRIADALGTPDAFASTQLGEPGDDDLSALSGHTTFDAATYQLRLIPQGDELHVKYVFASEEYPEYVGSQYNDVMQVLVNGQSCAFVPGTSDPVAVNTINATTNAGYFVDNSAGAAGYATSMDGLTVPLTCTANVTPGQEVTVKIAVADSSDSRYDSAVALVDKGIWSD